MTLGKGQDFCMSLLREGPRIILIGRNGRKDGTQTVSEQGTGRNFTKWEPFISLEKEMFVWPKRFRFPKSKLFGTHVTNYYLDHWTIPRLRKKQVGKF